MGSVRFDGEDESKPSTSDGKKYKSSKRLLRDCGAPCYASAPRKLRSAIKKRGHESTIPRFPISRKQRHVPGGVEKLAQNGAKKSRLIMKQGHITKDEEEVAETLYALADMFSDVNKPTLEGEPSKIKSSAIVEAGSTIRASEDAEILKVEEESRKTNKRVTLEDPCPSSVLANSTTADFEKSQSLDGCEQTEVEFCKQSATPGVSGVQSHLSVGSRSKMSTPEMIQSCERMSSKDQVLASGIQYGKYNSPKDDKCKGVLRSATQGSCLKSLDNTVPTWSVNTQPSVVENSFATNQIHYPRVVLEPKKSWKRCSTHVSVTRLIKLFQVSETSKLLLPKRIELASNGSAEQRIVDNQKKGTITNGVLPCNEFIFSASLKDLAYRETANPSHNNLHQDQQQDSKRSAMRSSSKQGSEFLSSATSEGIDVPGYSLDTLKQCHVPYEHLQNYSAMTENGIFSPFHGRTSAEAALQVQLSPYLMNTFGSSVMTPLGHKLESQQQKWNAYNLGRVATPHLQDWQNRGSNSGSLSNNAQALFPHLNSALGSTSKCQHFSQMQLMPGNSSTLSNLERHHRRLNPAINGTALYSDNIQQIQLL